MGYAPSSCPLALSLLAFTFTNINILHDNFTPFFKESLIYVTNLFAPIFVYKCPYNLQV